MPLDFSDNYNFIQYTGLYNRNDETFAFNQLSLGNKSNGDIVTPGDWYGVSYTVDSYYSGLMPVFGFSLGTASSSSSLSVPDGSTLSVYINDVYAECFDSNYVSNTLIMSPSLAVPYRVFADMYFTATQQIGTTHSGTYHNQTVELTNFFSSAQVPYNPDYAMDLNIRVPIQVDQSNLNENIDNLYNINLRYIKIYAVYDFSMFLNFSDNNKPLSQIMSIGDTLNYRWAFRNNGDTLLSSRITVSYSGGSSGTSIDTSTSAIQSSIASLTTNVSNQLKQVTNTVTQSTNTITTKIDTMSQDIQTGLQNVVQSAQQNTQNIINTVTQKVDEVKTGITEVKDSIIDLPNKIQEMLIGLFVPDEETINAKYSEFDQLLSDRFGLIYQSADIIHDFADSFQTQAVMTADTGGLISLPSVTVNLAGTAFTFGGYEVDIIPDGFEQLQTAVRLAVSMVCTVVFVNMCKNKLEAILK